jgi:hypothetical protein
MMLEKCIRGLAFEVELGEASFAQGRVDSLIISYIRSRTFDETNRRRRDLADAFKIAVPPSPVSGRILDRILSVNQ